MKRIYPFIIFIYLACVTAFAAAAPKGIDSLKNRVFAANGHIKANDTITVNNLNKLADNCYESAPDSTIYYSDLAIGIAKKINYQKGIAAAYVNIALVNSFKGDYTTANTNYKIALHLYKQINNQFGISEAYMGLGRVQDFLGNYDTAIHFFEQALAIRIKLRKEIDIADCYGLMGITYDNKGKFSKALDYYFKALIIQARLNEQLAAADNYCNIGVVMQHLELYSKALDYFDKANKIWLKLNDKQGISTCYQNIGEVMMSQKNYPKAIGYFKRASAIYHDLGDEEGISLIYYDLGLYHYYTSKPDSALYYLNMSLQSASKNKIQYNKAYAYVGLALIYSLEKKYDEAYKYALLAQHTANNLQSLNTRAEATLQLSKALAGLKQFEEAYAQNQLYLTLKDSLKNDESLQKLLSYNMAIEFENNQRKTSQKEEALVQKIAEQRRTNIIAAIIIVVITTMLIVYYNAKRKQLKANALLAEKNKEVLIQTEKLNELNILKDRLIGILAHDLRAPLSTLRGMFSLMADKDITHTEFIDMVPGVFGKLEHTSDFLDTLLFWINSQVDNIEDTTKSFCLCDLVKAELANLEDQFKLKNITPVNKVGPGHMAFADPNSIRIVIHNFLTNAIKFSYVDSTIEISARMENEKVYFMVTDQGIGMSAEQLNRLFISKVTSHIGTMNESGTGMGLIFCKDLIEKYNGEIWAKSILHEGTELGFALAAGEAADTTPNSDQLQ
ncbi:tetratricopeptide repeat protein [Mucilaginibacter terrigena]|uniref:histidine kinase n=1 Tax=Mucilaginibacter terrigena TaxID=2492395 RepID=A0A4Q5LK96_9SPHI|nr:tetratricopeptide repeat-containing sensor histidine kinase [Mucilaginibacter terrigena]RYU90006.1 tetratricopeptide repeat protein [Mucilaginibacter terrigena]